MPLPLPDLDDRTYEELVEEARAQIATLYPEWTDHNPSDAGITLIELFAWLVEMLVYRVNRVPDAHYVKFLDLLNNTNSPDPPDVSDLDTRIRQSTAALRERYRAVNADDHVYLLTQVWPVTEVAQKLDPEYGAVLRAHCVPNANLDESTEEAKGHVSLVVLTDFLQEDRPGLHPTVRDALWTFLDEKRLLTARHHVVGPAYVKIALSARLVLQSGVLRSSALKQVLEAVRGFFHPLTGGAAGHGWPFGRDVYFSEVYELLDKAPGVDYVEDVDLAVDDADRRLEPDVRVKLEPHELVDIDVTESSFSFG